MNQSKLARFFIDNAVTLIFVVISVVAIPLSGYSLSYLAQEIVTRLGRNMFLVLSLLIPILAGMGLNFGITLGAMAGQIGLIFVSDWNIMGVQGILLAALIGTPISIALGWVCGSVMNRAKGREMVTSYILGFFIDGVYQLVVLYCMGAIIPIISGALVLSRGYGIRNAVNLVNIRQVVDNLIPLKIAGISIPVATFLVIIALCLFIVWFKKTKLGQDLRAVGQDMTAADAAGIPVERTRIVAVIISTVLACYGQIIFLQNLGTLNTYNSHTQTGMFAIAALLIGGASVSRAKISNALIGVILFHLLFIVSPMAGKTLVGSAQIGEYFRQFISFGIITVALVLHAWKRRNQSEQARSGLRGGAEAVKPAESGAAKGE